MSVYDKVLSNDFVRGQTRLLAEAKNRQSVWDHMSKIYMAVEKLKTAPKVSFGIASITHNILSGLTSVDQYARRDMEGRGRHDLGHFGLLGEKYDMRTHMGTELAKEIKLGDDCCTFLHEWASSSHEFYYAKFGGPKSSDKRDKTWMGVFSPAEQRYIMFMEEVTHKVKHDGHIKSRIMALKTSREVLESTPFKEELAEITKLRLSELAINDQSTAQNEKSEFDKKEDDPIEQPDALSMDFILDHTPAKLNNGGAGDLDVMIQKQVAAKKLQDADANDELTTSFQEAEALVDTLATLIVEPESADSFADQLQNVSTGRIKGWH